MIRFVCFVFACVTVIDPSIGQETVRVEGVNVRYSGIGRHYAEAIAGTVSSARKHAIDIFHFEMPETIFVEVMADPAKKVRLFNDGYDRFSLNVRSEKDLAQPRKSGIFHIYGLCHEVGHLAMYRPIRDHSWLTFEAAEGWAHYLGSRLVDEVYATQGADLWPDQYDYRLDGMQRLRSQLESDKAIGITKCAGLWQELTDLAGDDQVATVFAAWGAANIDSSAPEVALKPTLQVANKSPELNKWWEQAKEFLILTRPKSGFVSKTLPAQQLDGEPQELAHDDGQSAGKNSSAGSGHAVRFETSRDGAAYLTAIRMYGGRYGRAAPPKEDFHVWLCDEEFKSIAEFRFPYSKFKRGEAKWVTLKTKPTKVPAKFFICVGFNPTATKGVYANYDAEGSGNSFSGLPGKTPREFDKGDWLIRATLENPNHDFAIKGKNSEEKMESASRTWTDSTGNFTIVAEFVEFQDGSVQLRKADGQVITIPLDSLSRKDQEFVKNKLP